MARTTLTKLVAQGPYPVLPITAAGLDVVETAADVANKNQFIPSGDDLLIVHNTGAAAYTVTLTSAPDAQNRTGDITTYSVGIGVIALFRINSSKGWVQTDGNVYIEAANAAVKFAVVAL